MSNPAKRHATIVAHSHWDRAWYLTFNQFRHRLVLMIDRLLDLLETDATYRCFVLDGQTILVDDYLDIKPENEPRLRRLIEGGRLVIGPWYILPDLFLESAEAIVRNLQIGLSTAESFGHVLPVGYVPDPFGHIAQMPQILKGFNLDTFIFMRGMPEEIHMQRQLAFHWQAPDGSKVLAYCIRDGYFNASSLGHPSFFGRFDGRQPEREKAVGTVKEAFERVQGWYPDDLILLNNGMDHMPEQPELPGILDWLRQDLPDTQMQQADFATFMDLLKKKPVNATYQGDLLGNPDHPILLSVYSTRSYLKQQNHRAESSLVRHAEPFSAMVHRLGGRWADPSSLLAHAWKRLLQNHPHDDICGCSTDGVHQDNEVRFREVSEIADSVVTQMIESLMMDGFEPLVAPAGMGTEGGSRASRASSSTGAEGGSSASGATGVVSEAPVALAVDATLTDTASGARYRDVLVYNPHPFAVQQHLTTEVMFPNHKGEEDEVLPEHHLAAFDAQGREIALQVIGSEAPVLKAEFTQYTWGRRYTVRFAASIPALGYQVVRIVEGEVAQATHDGARSTDTPASGVLENTSLRVDWTRTGLNLIHAGSGLRFTDPFQLEYVRDNGDTYSFSRFEEAVHHSRITSVSPHPDLPDHLRIRLLLVIPPSLDVDEPVQMPVTMDLGLNEGQGLTLHVRYTNIARNGRLRILMPVGFDAEHTLADGHFRLAEHRRAEEQNPADFADRYKAYPGELTYPTHFQQDFCLARTSGSVSGDEGVAPTSSAGATTVWAANRGQHEYQLTGSGSHTAIAITLHRAVGHLSVSNGSIRRPHAGPKIQTPGAQCLREHDIVLGYGITVADATHAMQEAITISHPLIAREFPVLNGAPAVGPHPRAFSLIRIQHPGVRLSSLRLRASDGACIIRLFNPTADAITTQATHAWKGYRFCETDLRERWLDSSSRRLDEDVLTIEFDPYQIKTFLLRR